MDRTIVPDPLRADRHINTATGIWPIDEWGAECARGFVSNARFDRAAKVIKRTNRDVSRAWRRVGQRAS